MNIENLEVKEVEKCMRYNPELVGVLENAKKAEKRRMVEEEQVRLLQKILDEKGIKPIKTVKIDSGWNTFYVGKKIVYIVIQTKTGNCSYTIVDRKFYDEVIADSELSFSLSKRQDGNYKILVHGRFSNGKKTTNNPLHRLVTTFISGVFGDKAVDHITHNPKINIGDYLRYCTNIENAMNHKMYAKINYKKKSFTIRSKVTDQVDREYLKSQGYKFTNKSNGEYVVSPKFKTDVELYNAVAAYEKKYLGVFRYDPLLDFSETWYSLVWNEFIEAIDIKEYNRDYVIRTDDNVAKYYQLCA